MAGQRIAKPGPTWPGPTWREDTRHTRLSQETPPQPVNRQGDPPRATAPGGGWRGEHSPAKGWMAGCSLSRPSHRARWDEKWREQCGVVSSRAIHYVCMSGNVVSPSGPCSSSGCPRPVCPCVFLRSNRSFQDMGEDPHPHCQPARSTAAVGERHCATRRGDLGT